ncbi:MAG: extracellular solute-binding protein [Lachnospiraceae bacterium]|nr:extracellular solute-binding protein [Lachnospiraceae bacterium]
MKRKKYIVAGLVILLFSLAGCGKSKENAQQQLASSKEYVYRVTPLEQQGWDTGSYSGLMKSGDFIYAYGYEYNYEEGTKLHIASVSEDGRMMEEGVVSCGENTHLGSLVCDEEGFLYGIKNVYEESEEEGYKDYYSLVKMESGGEELFSIYLNELPQIQEIADEDGWFYTGEVIPWEDSLYVNVMGNYLIFDKEGEFQDILKAGEENSLDQVNFYPLENGEMAGIIYEEDGSYACYVDMEKGEIRSKSKIPGTSYDYSIYPGDSRYELYLVNSYGVFGYNIGDEDKTQLMNYIDSDLGLYSIYNLVSINDKEFLGTYDDMDSYESLIGKFSKVDPEDVKDKQTIVLACTGLDWGVKSRVVQFNKSNEEYRISIQDYSSLYATDTDYEAGINRLNADIISGKIPDIILLSSEMPVESYISKGLFEDLKPYIERDEELDINDYMPNIIEAYSVDGKLYRLVPSYMISTLVAKTADVGKERGWTVQDVNDLMASRPEGTLFTTYVDRNTMLWRCMNMASSQFIDWEAGTCNFDSESFVEMLEFINQFPKEISSDVYTDDYWNNYDSMWREGKVITQMYTVSSFRDYNYVQNGTFGEEITMIGFPSDNKDGSAIIPDMQLVMSSKSTLKEGAWQFLRYYLTDEFQEGINYGLPLSIEQLEKVAAEATKNPTYTDEEGNEVESPDYFYMNGVEIVIDPMTQEEVDRLKEELYSFTQVYSYDANLLSIIQEESEAYFEGQKKAEDVARIIQSRAQLYVNENR